MVQPNNQHLTNYVILASDPGLTCTETTSKGDDDFGNLVEGEQITLTCETTYHGLWGPTQNWTDSAGHLIPAIDISSGSSSVAYTYIVSKILQFEHFRQLFITSYYGWLHLLTGELTDPSLYTLFTKTITIYETSEAIC